MPRAAKSSTRARKARADPLSPKSGNVNKKAPSQKLKAVEITAAASSFVDTAQPKAAPAIDNNEPNYLLMVALTSSFDPMITRLLSVPPTLTFSKLHAVLQIAFGWMNCHMHAFNVTVPSRNPCFPYRAKCLQSANTIDLELPGQENLADESKWSLKDVFEKTNWEIEIGMNQNKQICVEVGEGEVEVVYEYDMGDSWEHQITLLGRTTKGLHKAFGAEEAGRVLCLGGEGHPCAEDCGAEPGWMALKEAFKKPRGDANLKNWYKMVCANGDKKGLDPYKWDIFGVNKEIYKLHL